MNQTNRNEPIRDRQEEALHRFVGGIGEQIFNRDLLCARCTHLWEDETAECEVYEQKPLAVLRGEASCPEFVPKEENGEEEHTERKPGQA